MSDKELETLFSDSLKKIAPDTEPEKLQPDDPIRQSLALDSFDFLQFIILVSENLKISIPEEDYSKVTTLRGLNNYIKAKLLPAA